MSTITQSIASRPILRTARFLLRLAIAALFLFAAITKLVDPSSFAQQIANYQLTPWPATAVLSIFLPALELCVGVCLLLGRWESGALAWVAVLLTIFSGALLSAIVRGLSIDCGCFGRSIENTGTVWPLIRNLALLAVTGFLWFSRKREGVRRADGPGGIASSRSANGSVR